MFAARVDLVPHVEHDALVPGASPAYRRAIFRLFRFLNGGVDHRADLADRRKVHFLNTISALAFVFVLAFAGVYLLLDAHRLWPLSVAAAAVSPGFLVPLLLRRLGFREAAPHTLFGWMSLSLAVFGALGAGPSAGLHFFVMIVAVVPLVMWPSRRLLLAFYFVLNTLMFLTVELVPLGAPWVLFSPREALLVRTASILCTFGSITGILVGQAWFADRHRVQLKRRTHALSVTRDELREALATVQTLEGIIPICMFCKKTRDDAGYWQAVERFIEQRTQAEFSHGICPDCMQQRYPEQD